MKGSRTAEFFGTPYWKVQKIYYDRGLESHNSRKNLEFGKIKQGIYHFMMWSAIDYIIINIYYIDKYDPALDGLSNVIRNMVSEMSSSPAVDMWIHVAVRLMDAP